MRKAGSRIRITAQLIDTADGFHLFSETWDRDLEDIFTVQDEISRDVAEMLQMDTAPRDQQDQHDDSIPADLEAYQLYLKALKELRYMTATGAEQALQLCKRALHIQSDFALAYSAMSSALMFLGALGHVEPREAYTRSRQLARRALSLDPNIGQAYLSIAGAQAFYDWDFDGALASVRQGIALNPGSSEQHALHATLLSLHQRHDEAVEEARYALQLDPLSLTANYEHATTLMLARRFDESLAVLESLPDSKQQRANVLLMRGWLQLLRCDYEMAEELFIAAREEDAVSRQGVTALGYLYALLGMTEPAHACLLQLQTDEQGTPEFGGELNIAVIQLGLGEVDRAFDHLEQAATRREVGVLMLGNSPIWDTLRENPRYQQLVERIGLPATRKQMTEAAMVQ